MKILAKLITSLILFVFIALPALSQNSRWTKSFILNVNRFRHHVDYFNNMEDENIKQAIPNDSAWKWMNSNIPLFECPQQNFEELFYYRWWTLRKHIKKNRQGICIHRVFSPTQLR